MIPDEAFQLKNAIEFLRGQMIADGLAHRVIRGRIDFGVVARSIDSGEDREESLVAIELVLRLRRLGKSGEGKEGKVQ